MATIRLRHYTRVSAKNKILADQRIIARDRNRVFVELANRPPGSARDVEARYKLGRGKANAYVEFDADESEVDSELNILSGQIEYSIYGNVDLRDRNAIGYDNH